MANARTATKPKREGYRRHAEVLPLHPAPSAAPIAVATPPALASMRTGILVRIDPSRQVWVQLEATEAGAAYCLLSTATLPLGPNDLGSSVVLWEAPDTLGIVMGRETPASNALASAEPARATELEALIDGQRVVLEAAEEIVLRCGDASIILKRNGRIVLKGAYVETCARGTNRIKGGSVKIN